MALNLRGVRESGTAFAIPTYGFMVGIIGMVALGLFRIRASATPAAGRERAVHASIPAPSYATASPALALVFLLLRAFSSGCAALTGVEAISNGVPAFRKPKSKNAATTLLLMGMHRGHDAARHHRAGQPDRACKLRRQRLDRTARLERAADADVRTTSRP